MSAPSPEVIAGGPGNLTWAFGDGHEMREASGKSLGGMLGWFCVLVGIVSLGYGIAVAMSGRGLEAFDGILLGGLALVAGCVILHRRERDAKQNDEPTGRA